MTFKAVIAAMIVATLVSLSASGNSGGVPGWIMAGSKPADYEMGVASSGGVHRGPAAFLKSKQSQVDGFGTMMQQFAADDYRNKRLRLSAFVRSEEVAGWAGLWMRVDGEKGQVLAFDNMQARPIKGTTGWQRYEVVLDVAPEARLVALGVLMGNSGTVWLDDVKVEVVPESVLTTSTPQKLPKQPQNLDFGTR